MNPDWARRARAWIPQAPACLPVRAFLSCLLLASTLTIWLGSADPWWRPKEWAVLILGASWLILRSAWNSRPIRSGQDRLLVFLMIGFLIHFCLKFIFPAIQAPGFLAQSPWPWLAFLHIMVALAWLTDIRRLIRLQDVQALVKWMAWLGVFLSVYMVFQKFDLDPVMRYVQWKYPNFKWLDPNHMIGLMGSPFQASAVLACLIPAISYQAFHAKPRLLWRTLLVFSLSCCWITHSISAFLAGVVGAVAASNRIQTRRLLLLTLVLGLFCLSGLYLLKPDIFLDHGRISMWKQAFHHFTQHPFLGIGLNRFKDLGIGITHGPTYAVWWAHNEWVHFATELGVLFTAGLAFYLGRDLTRLYHVHKALFGCMASILILSFFHIPFHLAPTLVISGLCLAASHIDPKRS